VKALTDLGLTRFQFLIAVVIAYIVMGCLVDSIGMMVITIPLLYPILGNYGIDLIWFGVVLVLLIELGQVTPPMGINLFVIQSIRPRGSLEDVLAGAAPFAAIVVLMVAILWIWPELALWLPNNMLTR
jgi:C4-dicarboxylate transporter, DctM subunit